TESAAWVDIWKADDIRCLEFQMLVIEGIDTDEVARRYSGSVEDYLELLNLYCMDGKRKLSVLRELWEKRDYKMYGIEVHGLKSASANVGAMGVSVGAKEQEKAVDRGDTAFVDAHIQELMAVYEMQIEHISEFLENDRRLKEAGEKKQGMYNDDCMRQIKEALESLENFHAKDCAHKIEELLEYKLQPDIEAKLTEIQGLLKLYEDEAAEQELRELLEQRIPSECADQI
ncbi:MAG: hypothetical protein K2G55_19110, partial [Lachnospiraceae bacterium]|nr:hypothetical protein [Lachnospiraceae bacterium]